MNKIKSFVLTITFVFILIHQGNAQQVLSSTGGTFQNSGGMISFTLGELAIDTYTQGETTITQGFHQSILVEPVSELPEINFSIDVFPNPVNDYIIIKIEKRHSQNMNFILYDINGKTLQNGLIPNAETEINFSSINSGTYILKIRQNENEIKTVKIVKQ